MLDALFRPKAVAVIGASTKELSIGNVIIRNLRFRDLWVYDPTGNYDTYGWDYIHLEEGSHHVWVDHCDLDQAYDGMIDLSHGADYLTAHNPATGAELWRCAGLNPKHSNVFRMVPSPLPSEAG